MTADNTLMIEPWYDLITSLPRSLGNTLIHWSENLSGWDPQRYDTPEEFSEHLQSMGQSLIDFASNPEDPHALEPAQTTLRWVADNLTHLWD